MSLFTVLLRRSEIVCWTVGLLLVGFFVSQLALGEAERVADVAAFERAYPVEAPDQSLWSESRIKAYEVSKAKAPASTTRMAPARETIPQVSPQNSRPYTAPNNTAE